MKEKVLALWNRLEQSPLRPFVQFIKFGLVGVMNTLISYIVELICYYLIFAPDAFDGLAAWMTGLGLAVGGGELLVIVVTALGFVISVTNAYYWNNRYVFRQGQKLTAAQHIRAYFKTVACYAFSMLVLAPAVKIWLTGAGIPYWGASLLSLVVTIPTNFLTNKWWAFRSRK